MKSQSLFGSPYNSTIFIKRDISSQEAGTSIFSFYTFNYGSDNGDGGDEIVVSIGSGNMETYKEVFKSDANSEGYPNEKWMFFQIEVELTPPKAFVSRFYLKIN